MLMRATFFLEIYGYCYDKKICKTSLVSLCWWSTSFISTEQNVMVSLHLHLPTIYITVNKTKWFGLGPSVGEMIMPRYTKCVRVRRHWKRAHAEHSYKVNKGVLRHVKTTYLARTRVMKRREREKHSLSNISSPFFLGRFVAPLLRITAFKCLAFRWIQEQFSGESHLSVMEKKKFYKKGLFLSFYSWEKLSVLRLALWSSQQKTFLLIITLYTNRPNLHSRQSSSFEKEQHGRFFSSSSESWWQW